MANTGHTPAATSYRVRMPRASNAEQAASAQQERTVATPLTSTAAGMSTQHSSPRRMPPAPPQACQLGAYSYRANTHFHELLRANEQLPLSIGVHEDGVDPQRRQLAAQALGDADEALEIIRRRIKGLAPGRETIAQGAAKTRAATRSVHQTGRATAASERRTSPVEMPGKAADRELAKKLQELREDPIEYKAFTLRIEAYEIRAKQDARRRRHKSPRSGRDTSKGRPLLPKQNGQGVSRPRVAEDKLALDDVRPKLGVVERRRAQEGLQVRMSVALGDHMERLAIARKLSLLSPRR
ncbi:hypothetical protein T492DRAFT_1002449 [Pavlovales sp. CCMP2436]|nr:hypothetical protein T492DRAFT_1002449 [Pavlovales sp. CCMP2436]